jgi:serine O-acetyltransferase
VNKWVDAFLDSYAECGGINHIDGVNLPSKFAVEALTQDLLILLFPGFWANRSLDREALPQQTADLIDDVATRLRTEVAKSLEFKPVPSRQAATVVEDFFEQLLEVRRVLQTDVEAAFAGDPAASSTDEVIVAYPGIEAIAVQRMAHVLHRQGVALMPRMMTEWAHSRTGVDIHPGATIGQNFFIDHGTGVVIGETVTIGNRVKIYHGVTLGARSTSGGQSLRGQKRHPTIEDDVTIYPGATILGGETVIGARTVIGGNVWLTQSVPTDSLVTMEQPKLQIKAKESAGQHWEI